jgi:hypothetical protein
MMFSRLPLTSAIGLLVASAMAWSCGSVAETSPEGPADARDASSPVRSDGGGAAEDGPSPSDSAAPRVDTLAANRDRLLIAYLAYLKSAPGAQSNGLDGSKLPGACELWRTLNPSAQSVYLTLTARLFGSKLGSDGSSMLSHATKVYRIAGGDGSTQTSLGKCGGDGNRVFLSVDAALHAALLAASTHKGKNGTNGAPDLKDVPAGTFWRDSHDLGGAHEPFDISDETDTDAPRGQVQFFRDPASAVAKAALGRTDLLALIDPFALEIDQDYDCPHNSNPLCSYTTYASPICIPAPSKKGTELYTAKYGSFDPTWQPTDCAGK